MSWRVLRTDSLEALVKTQSGHCSETQGMQEKKRDEEIGSLVHGEICAVAAVDRETEAFLSGASSGQGRLGQRRWESLSLPVGKRGRDTPL
jgi:hypothetical protein